jgi:hypothetical protein
VHEWDGHGNQEHVLVIVSELMADLEAADHNAAGAAGCGAIIAAKGAL